MKVLDLQCSSGHPFEGWFASEDDFVSQRQRNMVQCPVCNDPAVVKKLSAPRLNLSHGRNDQARQLETMPVTNELGSSQAPLLAAWTAMAKHVLANTTDVGDRFADEARKMHYGEAQERAIRGKTTLHEAQALVDEGIEVMPFALPQALKEPLQ